MKINDECKNAIESINKLESNFRLFHYTTVPFIFRILGFTASTVFGGGSGEHVLTIDVSKLLICVKYTIRVAWVVRIKLCSLTHR